ncbi:hypothetical protein MOO44_01630 (plasmid) [Nicoliella spurrieriana]|uniref:Uncharacterized protein n=1 Tax=Nicoliella spurrieriana TaxID=2925830 RepID=A0A976RQQ4_9LACO|nr:hypothetical protein MOO44_01630 [Nicoliella spurrieriana]
MSNVSPQIKSQGDVTTNLAVNLFYSANEQEGVTIHLNDRFTSEFK